MANVVRKAIAAALLAQLTPAGGAFTKGGRRLTKPESIASPGKPALFLIKPGEKHTDSGPGIPPIHELRFAAVIYISFEGDPNAVPADILDDLTDAIDAALAPTPGSQIQYGGRQTLGLPQTVYTVAIDGEVMFAPGDLSTRGEAVVPIRVILNQYP